MAIAVPHSGHRPGLARRSYPHRRHSPRSARQRFRQSRRRRSHQIPGGVAAALTTNQYGTARFHSDPFGPLSPAEPEAEPFDLAKFLSPLPPVLASEGQRAAVGDDPPERVGPPEVQALSGMRMVELVAARPENSRRDDQKEGDEGDRIRQSSPHDRVWTRRPDRSSVEVSAKPAATTPVLPFAANSPGRGPPAPAGGMRVGTAFGARIPTSGPRQGKCPGVQRISLD